MKNLENAFNRFFNQISKYPRYKNKYNPVQSYKTNNINNNIRINGKCIRLPKVGWIRFRTHQKITGQIQSVTVKKEKHQANILFLFYVKMLQDIFLRVIIVVVV